MDEKTDFSPAVGRQELENLMRRGYRYALSLSREPASAEDLLQDAWVGILAGRGQRNVPYLFKCIRNRFIDGCRRARCGLQETTDPHQVDCLDATLCPELDETLPVELAELAKAFSELQPKEREVLYLFAVEGYTAQEIAERTAQPRGTILSLVHRARQKLKLSRVEKESYTTLQSNTEFIRCAV